MAAVRPVLLAAALIANTPGGNPLPQRQSSADQLVIATTAQLAPVLQKTAVELQRQKPPLKVSIVAVGSDVAMAELYTRRADLAIIGRSATDPEIKAFQWIYQYPPEAFAVLSGSVASPGHSPAVRVLVNASNPIRSISAEQLRVAFRAGGPVRWSDLGVKGPLGGREVHAIMPDTEQGTGRFIREALFDGATLFAWNRVREYKEPLHRDSRDDAIGERIASAVAADRQALALVPGPALGGTRSVPLSCDLKEFQSCDSSGTLPRTVHAYSDPKLSRGARLFLMLLAKGSDHDQINPAPYRQLPPNEVRELLTKLR